MFYSSKTPAVTTFFALLSLFSNVKAQITWNKTFLKTSRIIISVKATESEKYAAQELQKYVEKIFAVKVKISSNVRNLSKNDILIGHSQHLKKIGSAEKLSQLKDEEAIIRTAKNHLIIFGGRPRGTLYGVYIFLEDYLGVRWFTPKVEKVPAYASFKLPKINKRTLPRFEFREVYWSDMRDPDFSVKHKLNGNIYAYTDKHGGRFITFQAFAHTMDDLVPRSLYADHPEYFPLVNFLRKNGPDIQRCLSNPDVLKLTIQKVKQWFRENPAANVVSVSQNDGADYCECSKCNEIDEAHGNHSASIVSFVNAVAKSIKTDFPDKKIDTLAYLYSTKAPRDLPLEPNVNLRLSSIDCDFAHPIEEQNPDKCQVVTEIANWSKLTKNLYIWDYTTNFSQYVQPFPNFDVLQKNIKFFLSKGATGVFEQGNMSPGASGELGALKAYLLAKLLWNPDTDVDAHTTEFLDAYYGPASKKVYQYLRLMQDQVRPPELHARFHDKPNSPYLNKNFLFTADQLLSEAESITQNPDHKIRIQTLRMSIWYVLVMANHVDKEKRYALISQILDVMKAVDIRKVGEHLTVEEWLKTINYPK